MKLRLLYLLLVAWCLLVLAPGVLTLLGVFGHVGLTSSISGGLVGVWVVGYLVQFAVFMWAMSIVNKQGVGLGQIVGWLVASLLPWAVDWGTPANPALLVVWALIAVGTAAWIGLTAGRGESLLEHGVPAVGVVIEVLKPRMNVVVNDVYIKRKVRLQVQREDHAPTYEAVLDGLFMLGNIPSPGDRLPVLVDPNKPQRVVYDSAGGQADSARQSAAVRETLADAGRESVPGRTSTGARDGVVEELEKLAGLHARGVLTDAEFAAAKAKLLRA